MARGTPTFALFRGPQVRPEKWEEFKPKDLCEKILQAPFRAGFKQEMADFKSFWSISSLKKPFRRSLASISSLWRLEKVFPKLSDKVFERMDELQTLVSCRGSEMRAIFWL